MNLERRNYRRSGAPELRAGSSGRTISGAAALFNQTSQNLGGFVEQIAPGAFTRTLQTADVVALFNHNNSQILGRTSAGNLKIEERDAGLFYEVTPPATSVGDDAIENIRAGLVTGSSFAFRAIADEWTETDQGYPLRTVTEAQLFDVGPVTTPAYAQTSEGDAALAVRSFCQAHGIDARNVPATLPASLRDMVTIWLDIDVDVDQGMGEDDDEAEEIETPEDTDGEIEPSPISGGMPMGADAAPLTGTLSMPRARLIVAEMRYRAGL